MAIEIRTPDMSMGNYILPAAAPRNPIEDMNKYLTYNYNAQLMADKQAEQNLAMEQQKRYEEEQALFLNNPKPTVKDAVRFMGAMTPQQQQTFKPIFDQIDQKELRSSMMFGSQVMSALETDPAVAQRLLKDRAEAERNSGNADSASFIDQIAAQAASSPENAMKSVTMFMSTIPGAKDFFDAQYGAGQESRAQGLQPYKIQNEIANIQSERALAGQRATASELNRMNTAIAQAKAPYEIGATQARMQESQSRQELLQAQTKAAKQPAPALIKEQQLIETDLSKNQDNLEFLNNFVGKYWSKDPKTGEYIPSERIWQITGPLQSSVPTFGKENRDAEADIERAKGIVFLASTQGIDLKGVTAEETKQVAKAQANLDLAQRPEQILRNLKTMISVMEKAKKRQGNYLNVLSKRTNIPPFSNGQDSINPAATNAPADGNIVKPNQTIQTSFGTVTRNK
jgi:hypothetical protein